MLRAVATDNNLITLARLHMFPRYVLAPLPRGGKRGRAQARNILSKRLQRFRTSSLTDIIDDLKTARPPQNARRLDADEVAEDSELQLECVRRRVRALVAAGNLSKAANELVSTGLHRMTPAVQQKLHELHPQAPLPPRRAEPSPTPSAQCEVTDVRAAIMSFPTASAPGPSGLRADHLRDCITSVSPPAAAQLLNAVTALCNRCLAGDLPECFADLFLSARLLPFKKKDDGVRPIAVGEVLRRLVAKVAFRQILPKAQEILPPPTQLGVGVKDAVAHVAHAVRCAHDLCVADTASGILQIDVSNAFNCISRTAILDRVWADFPTIGKWAEFSLCHAGLLLTASSSVTSTNGVQQGDPLGPFLFSLGIHRIITQLKQKYGSTIQLWYLDDGVIAGKLHDLELFFNELATEFRSIGLMLNRLKCKLFTKGDCSQCASLSTIPRDENGLEVLGVPVGSEEFVAALASSKVLKAVEFCERVAATIDDPQIAVALLSMCTGACRVAHLMKLVPPKLIAPALNVLGGAMLVAFERAVGVSLPFEKLDRVFLPLAMSGFGLRRSLQLSIPSYLTSKMRFRFFGAALLQLPDGLWKHVLSDMPAVVSAFQATAPPSTVQGLQWLLSAQDTNEPHPDFCSLKWWTLQINQHTYNLLLDRSSARDRALIRCLTDRHANT